MERATKDAWLSPGAGDLKEEDVEDVPRKGQSVRVRALPAAYSNQATSEALVYKQVGREQLATVDTAKLECLQFAHGVIDPQFTPEEAEAISQKFGPAFRRVIERIDALSGVDKESLENVERRFPVGGTGEAGADVENGTGPRDGGPDLRVRTGGAVGDAG